MGPWFWSPGCSIQPSNPDPPLLSMFSGLQRLFPSSILLTLSLSNFLQMCVQQEISVSYTQSIFCSTLCIPISPTMFVDSSCLTFIKFLSPPFLHDFLQPPPFNFKVPFQNILKVSTSCVYPLNVSIFQESVICPLCTHSYLDFFLLHVYLIAY